MIFDEDFEYEIVSQDDSAFLPDQTEAWKAWAQSDYQDWRRFLKVKDGEEPLIWRCSRLSSTVVERCVGMQARRRDRFVELKNLLGEKIGSDAAKEALEAHEARENAAQSHWATPYFEAWRYSVKGWSGIWLKNGQELKPDFEFGKENQLCLRTDMAVKLFDKAFNSVIACGRIMLDVSSTTERRKN